MTGTSASQAADRAARRQRRGGTAVSGQPTAVTESAGVSDHPEQADTATSVPQDPVHVQDPALGAVDAAAPDLHTGLADMSGPTGQVPPDATVAECAMPKLQLGPIIKLTSTNFRIWSCQVQLHLDSYGMTACYDTTVEPPATDRQHVLAKAHIITSLSENDLT